MSELVGRKLRSTVKFGIGGIIKSKIKQSLETKKVDEEEKVKEPTETFKSKYDQQLLREVELEKAMIKRRLRNEASLKVGDQQDS